MKYEGHSVGYYNDDIPPGLAEKIEAILFRDNDKKVYSGKEREYKEAREALNEVTARILEVVLDKTAKMLRPDVVKRIEAVATEDEMDLLRFWQGRVTPKESNVEDLMLELSTLPGAGDGVSDWWVEVMIPSYLNGSSLTHRRVLNIGRVFMKWNDDERNDPASVALCGLLMRVVTSLLGERPTVSDIWKGLNAYLQKEQHAPRLWDIALTYIGVVGFWMSREEREDGEPSKIPALNLYELEQEVRGLGLDYIRDCGHIGSIDEIRKLIAATDGIIAPCEYCDSWVVSSNGYRTCCPYHQRGVFRKSVDLPGKGEFSLPERRVYGNLGPEFAESGYEGLVLRLALMHNTTPQHIRLCLSASYESSDCPDGGDACASDCGNALVPRERCPFADACPTKCGEVQRLGRAFPITSDGLYESCRVHFFLTGAEGMEREARDEFALSHLEAYQRVRDAEEKTRKLKKKASRNQASESGERVKSDEPVTETEDDTGSAQQSALF